MKTNIDDTPRTAATGMQELYSTGVKIRRALLEIPEADADKEFERTMNSLKPQKSRILMTLNWKRTAAAAAIALVIGSVAATGLIGAPWSWRSGNGDTAPDLGVETTVNYLPDGGDKADTLVVLTHNAIYDQKPLDEILKEFSQILQVPIECTPEKVNMRIYLSLPAGSTVNDLVQLLNAFDQIDAELVSDANNNQKLVVK